MDGDGFSISSGKLTVAMVSAVLCYPFGFFLFEINKINPLAYFASLGLILLAIRASLRNVFGISSWLRPLIILSGALLGNALGIRLAWQWFSSPGTFGSQGGGGGGVIGAFIILLGSSIISLPLGMLFGYLGASGLSKDAREE